MFIAKTDRIPKEKLLDLARSTLKALLDASEKQVDETLRERLRLYVRMGCENGFSLGLTDSDSSLGKMMSRANVRSRALRWL